MSESSDQPNQGPQAVSGPEAIAGIILMALLTRNEALTDAWVERTATLITKGINA